MEDPAPAIPLEKLVAHREWVRRVARALVRDEALAEDLEQDVWLEALRRPPRSGRSFGGWLAAAMKHNLIDVRRSEGRRRAREEAASRPEAEKSAAEVVAEAELLRKVVAAVLDLKEPARGTLLLRYFEDLPLKEVARRQGIPLETVRTRVRTGLGLLRARFDAERGGDRKAWALALLPLVGGPVAAGSGAGAGSAAAAGAAAAWGGLLMAKKAVAAVAAVLLLGWAGWLTFRTGDPEPGPTAPGPVARIDAPGAAFPVPSPPPNPSPAMTAADEPLPPLGSGFRLTGKVVDALGDPVPEATILSGALSPGDDPVREVIAVADALGEFSIHLRQRPGWVWAEAPGHASSRMANVLPAGATEDTVTLMMRGAAGRIEGSVRNDALEPVADARIVLKVARSQGFRHRNPGEPLIGFETLVAPATTDAAGRFVFAGLPPGPREVMVESTRYAGTRVETTVAAGETVHLDIRLSVGAVVFGLLRTPEGAPARGIPVLLVGMNGMRDRDTRTDDRGEYRFDRVPEGGVAIRASDGGGAFFEGSIGARDGAESRLDGQLLRKRGVSGRLVDSTDRSLRRWRVTCYIRTGDRLTPWMSTTSDEEGRFEIRNLPPGDAVVGVAPPTNAAPRMIGLPQGETIPIDTGIATGTVAGMLTGEAGNRHISLRAMRRDDPTETWVPSVIETADHRFKVELPPGEYLARVTTAEGGVLELPPLSVLPGTTTDVGVIDLSRLFPVTLVVDPTWTDRGMFTLSRLRDGDVRTVIAMGNLRHEIQVRLGEGDYVVHVEGADIRPCESRFSVPASGATVDVPITPSPGGATFQFILPGRAGESFWITLRDREGIAVFDGLLKVNAGEQAGWGMNVEAGRYSYRLAGSRVFEGELELSGSPPTGSVRVE